MNADKRIWYVIEDEIERGLSLSSLIKNRFDNDFVYWYLPSASEYFDDEVVKKIELKTDADHFVLIKSLKNLLKICQQITNRSILLLDIVFEGINTKELHDPDNKLKIGIEKILFSNKQTICALTSSKLNLKRQAKAFNEDLKNRIVAENFDVDEPTDAKNLIIHCHLKWADLFLGHPMRVFLKKTSKRYSAQQLLNHTEHNHNWTEEYPFPPPQITILAELLNYSVNDFLVIFNIKSKDNPIGELLKVFGTRDVNKLTLLGIIFIAWSVYRKESKIINSDINNQFISIIQEILSNFEFPDKKEYTGYLCRYGDMLADQDTFVFQGTLIKLYDMFEAMFFRNDIARLRKIKLNKYTLSFFIDNIDPSRLLKHLNECIFNILEKQKLIIEHDSVIETNIFEFWLRFNYCNGFNNKSNLGENNIAFSNGNAFSIVKKNDSMLAVIFKYSPDG